MAQQLGSNYYNSPYKFNGKELDEETGFYYYGARYYDPKISIWLSTDPLAEKFPNFNPYNYVMQNPLNLIDPTGMSPEEGGNDSGKKGWFGKAVDTVKGWFSSSKPKGSVEVGPVEDKGVVENSNASVDGFDGWTNTGDESSPALADISDEELSDRNDLFLTAVTAPLDAVGVSSLLKYGIKKIVQRQLLKKGAKEGIKEGANIGTKLEYVFGKATGAAHNIERSTGMLRQLESIGIFDNSSGRTLLKNHLESVYSGTKGILQTNGRYLRESLLMGPNGGVKVESIWEGNKLITIKLIGGR